MAIFYSNIGAVQVAPTAKTMLDAEVTSPTTRTTQPVYTFTGTEVAGDTIYLEKLPAGATVIPFLCNVYSNGVAGTATITVGDAPGTAKDPNAAVTNRYSTALDVAASGVDAFTGGAAAGAPYQIPALGLQVPSERWLTATLATLVTPVAGQKLQFNITKNIVI